MKDKLKNEYLTPQPRNFGWWRRSLEQLQLTWNLMLDGRMPILYKLIPLITLAYIISPLDLIPDMFVGIGMLDDLGILMLGISLFNSLAPGTLAIEHLNRLRGVKTTPEITVEKVTDPLDDETLQDGDRSSASKRL